MNTIQMVKPGDKVFFAEYEYTHLKGHGIVHTTVHSVDKGIHGDVYIKVNANKRLTFHVWETTNDKEAYYNNGGVFAVISLNKRNVYETIRNVIDGDKLSIDLKKQKLERECENLMKASMELKKSMNKILRY